MPVGGSSIFICIKQANSTYVIRNYFNKFDSDNKKKAWRKTRLWDKCRRVKKNVEKRQPENKYNIDKTGVTTGNTPHQCILFKNSLVFDDKKVV